MEGSRRLVEVSGALLVLAVIWLFVLVTLNSLPLTTDPSPVVAPTIVTSPEGSGNPSDQCSVALCAI